MKIRGQMSEVELKKLSKEFVTKPQFAGKVSDGFDPFLIKHEDKGVAEQHGVKPAHLKAMIKREDYTEFSETRLSAGDEIFEAHFPRLVEHLKVSSPFCFRGYWAMEHNDKHIPFDTQIMLIISNAGHQLYSEDGGIIVPKSGDMIEIDTWKQHALYPAPKKTAQFCSKSPLEFYAVPFKLA